VENTVPSSCLQKLQLELQLKESKMTDAMSEPIPKKQMQVEAFAEATTPLWPRSTWIPEKENSVGEKTRSLESELSTKPGDSNGKNSAKSFKIGRSGNPEEWTLWRRNLAWTFNQALAATRWSASSHRTSLSGNLNRFSFPFLSELKRIAIVPQMPLPS
jgi:hypothetical protein